MKASKPEYNVKVRKNVLIPTRDGVNLACDLYMPDVPGQFPAVMNYTPYHKDDFIGARFSQEAFGVARRGYVYVFLDARGTGGSEGAYPHPFRFQLWEDGYDAVEWLSQQPWCDGNVGMWGISYPGYSSANVASLAPPHLKAVVPIQSDVSWFTNHHPGGALNCLESTISRASRMSGLNFMPPMYTDEEGRWLKIWNYHLEHNKEELFELYEHPTEDAFMREGAVLFRLDKIKAATYVIGSWRDLNQFSTGQFVLYNGVKAPKKLLSGPWKHGKPSVAPPGPNIDYVSEMIRWFDYWLKGIDTGIMDEPPITIYVQGANGKWRCEKEWPIARRKETVFYLHPEGALESKPYEGKDESVSFDHNATVGTTFISDGGLGIPRGFPLDQRADEALSLTYTTGPLPEDTEITGAPILKLFASTSVDEGVFVAKLNDVAPDGSSAAITCGNLNVAHRESLEQLRPVKDKLLPVKPGEVYELLIKLNDTSYLVKAGHRLRLAIASSDFPYIWPTPKAAVNTVYHNEKYPSQMTIPFVPEQKPSLPIPMFREPPPPMHLPPPTREYSKPDYRIERDLVASTVTVYTGSEEKLIIGPTTTLETIFRGKAVASAIDPANAKATAEVYCNIEGHKLGTVNIKGFATATCKGSYTTINITVNDLLVFSKRWSSEPMKVG